MLYVPLPSENLLTDLRAQLIYCSPVNSFWNPLLLGKSNLRSVLMSSEQDCHRPLMVNIVYVVTNMTSDVLSISSN